MKSLVIAEKPSVGRDIARVLGCSKGGNGFLEGKDYVVTWALGHLVELSDPESYGEQWKTWKMETLPMLPEKLEIQVIPKTGKQYQTVKTQMYRKDVNTIIIATDAGREGELVARWIIQKAGVRKPMKRLWISSVTDRAIRQGFEHLKDAKEYEKLYQAAAARAEADWLVGLNATRALTVKHNAQLSCGRVQTPTLAMIAKREAQIKAFQPKSYYSLKIRGNGISWIWKFGTDYPPGAGKSHKQHCSRTGYQKETAQIVCTAALRPDKPAAGCKPDVRIFCQTDAGLYAAPV